MNVLVFALLAALPAAADVVYEVRFDNAFHHEMQVTATFSGLSAEPLELRMSRSSPGRYALHEFAKNLYDVSASDGRGRPLSLGRPDPHGWRVAEHDGTVVFRYTVFGDRCDGTYLAVDPTHAHLNMPAGFVWARGLETRAIELRIVPPNDEWRVATQLEPTADAWVFRAPSLYYFLDSPTELSAHELHEWTVDGQTMRLALHHEGTPAQGAAYAELAKAVVREETAVFGELPRFDYGSYTFIADYLPQASGDGMEHRNSTVLTTSRSLDHAVRNLGTVAHELFHAWNVERLRPRSLEPFDFERANMSGALWFAEGFTSYYDDLVLKRAGIYSLDRFAAAMTPLVDTVRNAPGREMFSPVEMSQRAPFVDAAVSIDPTNRDNTFVSYYTYGAALALGLELSLRTRFAGKTLDDVMRLAWQRFGDPEKPYELSDLESVVADVSGDPTFAATFFRRYVYASELPDYESLLARAGLALVAAAPEEAYVGASLRERDGRAVVRRTVRGGPAYAAGIDREDVWLSFGGEPLTGPSDLTSALREHAPGDRVVVTFDKRGLVLTRELELAADPRLKVVTFESVGRAVSASAAALRGDWLESGIEHGLTRHCHTCGREHPFEHEFCPYDGARLELTPRS